MKKDIFSYIVASIMFTITILWVFFPDSLIYETKGTINIYFGYIDIWAELMVIIMIICTYYVYYQLAGKLFDYLKQD